MPSPRDKPHLVMPFAPERPRYGVPPRKMEAKELPAPEDRTAHGLALDRSLREAQEAAIARRERQQVVVSGAPAGLKIQFESAPNVPLKLETLSHAGQGIEVLSVTRETTVSEAGDHTEAQTVERATVFVPDGKVGHFLKRFERYATETTKTGKRPHQSSVDRISALRLATMRALWTDAPEAYPGPEEAIWWEVWLRISGGGELERFYEYCGQTDVRVKDRRLQFHDRIVVLAYGTAEQMSASVDVLNDLAELQRAKDTADFFADQPAHELGPWILDLAERTQPPEPNAASVCVLDTGVNAGHPLLRPGLALEDCLTVDPTWGTHDHHAEGHGTSMAGLALYGDLTPLLAGKQPVPLRHRLESVKILPDRGSNEPDLYGAITADATAQVESRNPFRPRVFSMAVTTDEDRDRGQPSSWSAAVDALAAGRSFDASTKGLVYFEDEATPRLFVISAGNVDTRDGVAPLTADHLTRSDAELVEDPAQAWNALVVGASTHKVTLEDPSLASWTPVAQPGALSPWSTTSVSFAKQWPNKPDIVMEGGNAVLGPSGEVLQCDDLSLLSTGPDPAEQPLTTTWATSPATAQVARLGAIVATHYPSFWPETIRGLLVHAARWSPAMLGHLDDARTKSARAALLRRYGYGIPSLSRVLQSANDSATLIAQGTIRPFDAGKMGEIHLHSLPWPADALRDLGDAQVTLRVTLSYFIEPNPGRRGWNRPHRYQSHGLRFDLKGPLESAERFHKRLNQQARDEGERSPGSDSSATGWYLGTNARDRGSLHSDYIFAATGAELAERDQIAVYPQSGWWKEKPKRDRSKHGARYALLVTIETDAVDTDLWTPIATQLGVAAETTVGVAAEAATGGP